MKPRVSFVAGLVLHLALYPFSPSGDVRAAVQEDDPQSQTVVQRRLNNPIYRFCQDKEYKLFQEDKEDLCPNLASFADNCPELKNACARPSWEDSFEPEARSIEDVFNAWLGVMSSPLQWFFKFVLWVVIALCFFLIGRLLFRQTKYWRARQLPLKTPTLTQQPASRRTVTDARTPEELLDKAQLELENNQIGSSLQLTYQATIRVLERSHQTKPHISKTTGDYLAALTQSIDALNPSANSEELALYREHLNELDRARFSPEKAGRGAAQLLNRTRAFCQNAPPLITVALCLFIGACTPDNVPEAPNSYGAPRGSGLLEELISENAESITRRITPLVEIQKDTAAILVIGTELQLDQWQKIEEWVALGGHLLVAQPDATFADLFSVDVSSQTCEASLLVPGFTVTTTSAHSFFTETPPGEAFSTCAEQPTAVGLPFGDGWLTMVASTHSFENAFLAADENAAATLALVGPVDGLHVEYLGPWTGQGATNPIQSLVHAGFGSWVFHLLLVGLIYALAAGRRFAPLTVNQQGRRRAFVEHCQALSARYEKAQASGWALQQYTKWAIVKMRVSATSSRLDLHGLAGGLTTISQGEAKELEMTLATARRASELGKSSTQHLAAFKDIQGHLLSQRSQEQRGSSKKD